MIQSSIIYFHFSRFFPLLLIIFISLPVFSQNDNIEKQYLHGRVFSKTTGEPLANIHVINPDLGKGSSTRQDGTFSMLVSEGNKVFFQALGYETDTIYISHDHLTNPFFVELIEKVYELPVVNIYPYATFSDFKHAFLNFKDPDPPMELNLPSVAYSPEASGTGIVMKGPITELYNHFSRRGRELQKYQQLLASEETSRKASKVVNVELVQRVTGIQDEKEVYEFLNFCNITDEFILSHKEFEVYEILLACFKVYSENR
jgi:hypothetical protein